MLKLCSYMQHGSVLQCRCNVIWPGVCNDVTNCFWMPYVASKSRLHFMRLYDSQLLQLALPLALNTACIIRSRILEIGVQCVMCVQPLNLGKVAIWLSYCLLISSTSGIENMMPCWREFALKLVPAHGCHRVGLSVISTKVFHYGF